MGSFRRKTKQRYLACLGLFAVLMLTFGPTTSQILAMASFASHPATMSHHEIMDHAKHHNTTTAQVTSKTTTQTNHHAMNLCGYCDLLHTPVLSTSVIIVLPAISIHQYITSYYLHDAFSLFYTSPQSRAPPYSLS